MGVDRLKDLVRGGAPLDYLESGGELASGFLAARGARRAGRAEQRAAEYNAELAESVAAIQASRARRAARYELGRQRAAVGASGVQLAGSVLERYRANARELELEAADFEVAGLQRAALERARGVTAREEGRATARAEIVGGAFRSISGPARRRSFASALGAYRGV